MRSFYQKLPFALAVLCFSLNLDCGISEAEEEEDLVKIPDSPPQITITLRSDFIVEQPLEPDLQINKSAEKVQFLGKIKEGQQIERNPHYLILKQMKAISPLNDLREFYPRHLKQALRRNQSHQKRLSGKLLN